MENEQPTLMETITVTRSVEPYIADFVYFAHYLRQNNKSVTIDLTDQELVTQAKMFFDRQHGED